MTDQVEVRRFNGYHRLLHVIMAVSFLGLVASGMPLRYSQSPWASWLMGLMGGYEGAAFVHRVCAVITFAYFAAHIGYVIHNIVVVRNLKFNFLGPESMVPRAKDFRDIRDNFKWFVGAGPRPELDQWTYWEKFDYWAVFWGVGMIGVSGLLLWFPVFFSMFLPGWAFNIAAVIHSDEALLAAGFIFTIHFFNTHMRPEKFPMDTVIFSGRVGLRELRHERPLYYERLYSGNRIGERQAGPQPAWIMNAGIVFGFALILTGFLLLVLILLGQFYY